MLASRASTVVIDHSLGPQVARVGAVRAPARLQRSEAERQVRETFFCVACCRGMDWRRRGEWLGGNSGDLDVHALRHVLEGVEVVKDDAPQFTLHGCNINRSDGCRSEKWWDERGFPMAVLHDVLPPHWLPSYSFASDIQLSSKAFFRHEKAHEIL